MESALLLLAPRGQPDHWMGAFVAKGNKIWEWCYDLDESQLYHIKQLYPYKGLGGSEKTDARIFGVGTYPWLVPVFMYQPLVFTRREQFSRALTGFVSCVRINLLAKMLVVCEIIVIQNGSSIHIINATSFVQKRW